MNVRAKAWSWAAAVVAVAGLTGATPAERACDPACAPGAVCVAGACEPVHADAAELAGPFATPYEVTGRCVACHPDQAAQFMKTIHWNWAGPTPQLQGHEASTAIGKKALINNFCVAVASNEKRCDQCHAGYGGDPDPARPQKSALTYTAATSSIPLEHRIDCLVCHADPAAGYAKDPKDFGRPAATVDLARAARSVRKVPANANCGACHFYAGGGDNVKLMGSALKDPPASLDVHMGNGMTCSGCHAEPGHQFKGAGIHVPANVARASCSDCHGATPHAGKSRAGDRLDAHVDAIACQTCHVPTFSRSQFAKMDWDWSTAGDRTRGTNGVVKTALNDAGAPDPAGKEVVTYDFIKGDFGLKRNVKPEYAWYDGRMMHLTTSDRISLAGETGLTPAKADRITLSRPLGGPKDAKARIFPFKLMYGRQAFQVDGDRSFAIVPNVFGPGSLWGTLQSPGYAFDPAGRTYVTAATPEPKPFDALLSAVFTKGAVAAGQVPAGTTLARWDASRPGAAGWDWRYTKMYMDMNHEVAPKAQALGAGGDCKVCHSKQSVIDWKALGYRCGDPKRCPTR